MSVPKSLLSYTDCIDYFDTALRFSEGCRIPVPDEGFAIRLRMRLNYCRKLDRENNARVYPEGHPMYGVSQYDKITCTYTKDEGKWYLILGRNDLQRMPIEPLGIEVGQPALEALPEPHALAIEHHPQEMEDLEVVEVEPKGFRRI